MATKYNVEYIAGGNVIISLIWISNDAIFNISVEITVVIPIFFLKKLFFIIGSVTTNELLGIVSH